jgi:hypothetical protein
LLSRSNRKTGRNDKKSPFASDIDHLNDLASASRYREAIREVYLLSQRMASERGVTMGCMSTPSEVYAAITARYPSVAADLTAIVALFEKTNYGGMMPDERDARAAIEGAKELDSGLRAAGRR